MVHRREFLSATAAAALATAIARKADSAPAGTPGEWRNRQSGMAYRKLGKTGFMISEVVMGGNTISPTNYEHILEAMDRGLNYLDTAPAYGNTKSELGYAEVLKSRRRETFFLNSKVSLWDINRGKLYKEMFQSLTEPEQKKIRTQAMDAIEAKRVFVPDYIGDYFPSQRQEVIDSHIAQVMEQKFGRSIDRRRNYREIILESVEGSLKRLGTDHLDLLMCPHGASSAYELLNYPEIFDAFEVLKKAGKVRHLGVSAHNDPAGVLDAAVKSGRYSAAMVAYSIINDPYTGKAVERAHKAGVGVIAMKAARPVFNGRNNGTPDDPARVRKIEEAVPGKLKVPQKAYLWALRNPNLSAVISELVNSTLVRENLPLGAEKKPS